MKLVVNWVVNWMLLEQGRRRCPVWSKMVRKGSDKVRDASNPVVCGSLTQPQAGEEPRTRSQGVEGRDEAKAEVVSGHFAQDRDDSRERVSFKTS